jgi:hypothetical protein
MKKVLIITAVTLCVLVLIGLALYRPYQKWKFRSKINKIAIEYVTDILLINDYDSIKIKSIDTLSDMGFARLSLEMLEEMSNNYEFIKRDAILNGESDQTIDQIDLQQNEVDFMIAEQYNIANDEHTLNNNIKFYFIKASLFHKQKEIPFIFLVTPDCKYYEFDLFKD